MTDDLNNHERDKLIKLLRNAYIELCRAEKLLKGSEDNGKRTKLDTEQPKNSARTPRND